MNNPKIKRREEIISCFHDGQTIVIGGKSGANLPYRLIECIIDSGAKDLTICSIDSGELDRGIGRLIHAGAVAKMITTHIGTNPETAALLAEGKIEIEFNPMGSYIERLRCGGTGLGGVLTKTGLGTEVESRREIIRCNGEDYLLEPALRGDIAITRARRADPLGNLAYRGTGTASHPIAAMAADLSIVECDHFCDLGEISPDEVRVPGMFIDMILI